MPRGSCKTAARLVRKLSNLSQLKMEVPAELSLDLTTGAADERWDASEEYSKMTPRVSRALRQFHSAQRLQELTLVNSDSTRFDVSATVVQFLPRLRKLCLKGCVLTVSDMLCVSSRLTDLTELVISEPIVWTAKQVVLPAALLPNLKNLEYYGNSKFCRTALWKLLYHDGS